MNTDTEIKFKGFCKRDNKWVYGCYHKCQGVTDLGTYAGGEKYKDVEIDLHLILHQSLPNSSGWYLGETIVPIEVYPQSVGQYTGVKDKNGVEIYSGDKVYIDGHTHALTVKFMNGAFYTNYKSSNYRVAGWKTNKLTIVGNSFTPPTPVK